MRHNGRHNKGKPKRPRGPHGYYRRGDLGGWPVAKLQGEFLHYVAQEAPEVLADYETLVPLAAAATTAFESSVVRHANTGPLEWHHLEEAAHQARNGPADPLDPLVPAEALPDLVSFHDALKAWAERYYLFANWVLSGAIFRLRLAAEFGESPRLMTGLTFGATPASPPPIVFEAHGYTGLDNVAEYRERTLAAFAEVLEAHIETMVSRLEADPSVVADPFVDRRTHAALRAAALWQTRGEYVAGDFRTIRSVLQRIGLSPRPGLLSGKSEGT